MRSRLAKLMLAAFLGAAAEGLRSIDFGTVSFSASGYVLAPSAPVTSARTAPAATTTCSKGHLTPNLHFPFWWNAQGVRPSPFADAGASLKGDAVLARLSGVGDRASAVPPRLVGLLDLPRPLPLPLPLPFSVAAAASPEIGVHFLCSWAHLSFERSHFPKLNFTQKPFAFICLKSSSENFGNSGRVVGLPGGVVKTPAAALRSSGCCLCCWRNFLRSCCFCLRVF